MSIDRQVLNLIGAPLGIDFGTTTLDFTTDVSLTKGGSVITANTQFKAAKFSLTQKGQTTPPLDLQVAYDVTVNTLDPNGGAANFHAGRDAESNPAPARQSCPAHDFRVGQRSGRNQ